MSSFPQGERLSHGARSRLDDYIADFAEEIVSEADRLNPDDVITSRDISDAHAHIRAQRGDALLSGPGTSSSTPPSARRDLFVPIISGLLSMFAAALLVSLVLLPSSAGVSRDTITIVAALLVYAAAGLSVSYAYLSYVRTRRERTRAVRYAELGGRDTQVAYYLAEALSSRSSKSDDDAYMTARFVTKWARLEDRIRRLAIEALGMPEEMAEDYPIGPLLADFTRVGVLNKKLGDDFAQILDVRNRLAHGGRVSDSEVKVGLEYMDVLEKFLDEHIQSHALHGWETAAD